MKTTKTHTLPNIPHPLTPNISLVFLKSEEVKDSTGSGWLYHLHFVSLLTLTNLKLSTAVIQISI